jgi:hypothetical protein
MPDDKMMTPSQHGCSAAAAGKSRDACPVCGVALDDAYAGQRPCMDSWAGSPESMWARNEDLKQRGCQLFNRSRLQPAAAVEAPCAEDVDTIRAQAGAGEAVAWRHRSDLDGIWTWAYTSDAVRAELLKRKGHEVEPLYAHPSPAVPVGWRVAPYEPTEHMLYMGEGYADFMLPETHDNTREGRQRELRMAYQVMLDNAPASPSPTKED